MNSAPLSEDTASKLLQLMWGGIPVADIFKRWNQGFIFDSNEPTALIQFDGGPCAVISTVQAVILKIALIRLKLDYGAFKKSSTEIINKLLADALAEVIINVNSNQNHPRILLSYDSSNTSGNTSSENFHASLNFVELPTDECGKWFHDNLAMFQENHGVLLFLYSVLLSKGINEIVKEIEDSEQCLVDSRFGHGSQSLINLLLIGTAISNVWDGNKDVEGFTLYGIPKRSSIGFLTILEYYRYCEVGWWLKNPEFPIWVLGSETHLTLLFSNDTSLISETEGCLPKAKRLFRSFDSGGNGFIMFPDLTKVLDSLDLCSDPEYLSVIETRLDPERLGIVTENVFLTEFFHTETMDSDILAADKKFTLYHYNGLARSNLDKKIAYRELVCTVNDFMNQTSDTEQENSPFKNCLQTKWPSLVIEYKEKGPPPSLN